MVTWNGLVPHSQMADKDQERLFSCRGSPGELGVRAPLQTTQSRVPVPGREVSIASDCKKPWGLWLSETGDFWSPRSSSYFDSLTLSLSEQRKAPETYREELSFLASGSKLKGQLSPRQEPWQWPWVLFESSPYRACRQALHLTLHQPGSHYLPHLGDSLRPCYTQLAGPAQVIPSGFSIQLACVGSCFQLS